MKRIIGILCGLFFFLSSFAQETFQKETYISSRGLKNALLQKELIETNGKEIVLADPVFGVWFKKEMLY